MKARNWISVLGMGAALIASTGSGQSFAGEQAFGARTPSTQELIEGLAPKPRMRGIRPVTAAAEAPKVSMQLQFGFNSADLSPESKASLDHLSEALKSDALAKYKFVIEGHTDAKGPDEYNLTLSERRAAAVRAYLVTKQGVAAQHLNVIGKGKTEPLDTLNPYSAINRRVAIVNASADL